MSSDWQPIETAPEGRVIRTILADERGLRNRQLLVRIGGLWFFPDRSMYVYYSPTHRQEMEADA